MDVYRHDLLYWQLIQYFIFNGMKVLDIHSNHREVWLEHENDNTVVRLIRTELDWGNALKKDIDNTLTTIERVRKKLGYRTLTVENVYVSTFPPVDSYEHLLDEPTQLGRNYATTVYTSLLEADEQKKEVILRKLCQRVHIPFPPLEEWDMQSYENIPLIRHEVMMIHEQRIQQEKALFQFAKPRLTYVLLFLIGVMFGIVEYNGGSQNISVLIEFGAKYNPAIEAGEWWRFFTAMFLHIGLLHLIMNSLALYYLGTAVERIYGRFRFLFIYVIAGLIGSVASYAFSEQISAGASGAIFGCFGALLYFGLIHKKIFLRTMGTSLFVILAINLALGFALPVIDNAAHIGGLVGGFFASGLMHLPKHKKSGKQFIYLLFVCIAFVGLFFYGMQNDSKTGADLAHLQYIQELLVEEEIEEAYQLAREIVDEGNERPEAFFLLGVAEAKLGMYEEGKVSFQQTVRLNPQFHEAHYNLALIYMELEQYDDALQSVEKAIEIEKDEQYEQIRDTLLIDTGRE
ncbi:rhomboid family intramembrane serine protease [Alkalihalobacillus sp. LMS39]|uniref:rhomboid family protein n=1 Tax=Alkalihalobacillus sp. LMS39 TaxID=2924032 RepID=UPI001FB3B82B|nr:rhomboid family intramembrane serine protease [Alkalihalobacillus sp. LMS39]UOE95729.1 rhomboid family intramembrane serine protease [Alkalihalobacillus sp. LMS39]